MLKRIFGPTNRKIRLFVGLMLIALFCIQCVHPDAAQNISSVAIAIENSDAPSQTLAKARALAKTSHSALLEYCLQNYQGKIHDYTCTFVKQEKLGGVVGKEQEIQVRFKEAPFSVLMTWTKNAPQGDRVLFIEGKYNGKMLVRPASPLLRKLAPTVTRAVDGDDVRKTTLKPVNCFGIERSTKALLDVYEEARKAGDLREETAQDAEVLGRKCMVLVRYLPEKANYPAYKTVTYIDQEYMLPIMIEGFGWNHSPTEPDFLCRYWYKDLKFNNSLTDGDFAPEKNDLVAP